MDNINLATIRRKLASGEKLSTADLQSLEPLHDANYDKDGRVVGGNEEFVLNYVDRSFLDGKEQGGEEILPRLVRYVGKAFTHNPNPTLLTFDFSLRSKFLLTSILLLLVVYTSIKPIRI